MHTQRYWLDKGQGYLHADSYNGKYVIVFNTHNADID